MSDYSQGKIYILKSKNTDDVYIGSTKETLEERFHLHMIHYYKWLRTKKYYCTSFEIIKQGEIYIELLENYPCETKKELRLKEGEYQRMMDCVNKRIECRTMKEWKKDNKEHVNEYQKKYNMIPEVKEKRKIRQKKYKEEHKEQISKKRKEWHEKNKQHMKEYRLEKYEKNKKSILQQQKEYNSRPEVKEHKKEYMKEYQARPEVKEKIKNRPKIKCICGSEIRKDNIRRHEKSKNHIQYIEEMKEKADSTNLNEFFEQFKFKLTTN